MVKLALTALAVSAITLIAGPASAVSESVGGKVYPLKTMAGSEEYGTVALKPLGRQTAVEVHVVNAPEGVPQPVHIHDGTCAKVDLNVKYALAPVVDGTSESIIDVPMDKLLASPVVVDVHPSSKQELNSVACASLSSK